VEYIPDNYDLWKQYEAEQERWLARQPTCSDCGEYVQDEYLYLINDEVICLDCIRRYRKETADYAD